ncbi:MAG: hypothetical protein A2341_13615 [Deltaproteobacteria bacterium RIFOXYB12_FULL_58_9]|nr:MAG: hypothetical protein A2341_13615 [Deltaproteobacteria bacterium RIFOXYB12_FULL_58_9]
MKHVVKLERPTISGHFAATHGQTSAAQTFLSEQMLVSKQSFVSKQTFVPTDKMESALRTLPCYEGKFPPQHSEIGLATGVFAALSEPEKEAALEMGRFDKNGTKLYLAMNRALSRTPWLSKVDRERTLKVIVESESQGLRVALGILSNRKPSKIDIAEIAATFADNTKLSAKACWALVAWARRRATCAACSGVDGTLARILREQLLATREQDGAYFWGAIDAIHQIHQDGESSEAVAHVLVTRGCLPEDGLWGLTGGFLPGTDPIARLAGRPPRPHALIPKPPAPRPLIQKLKRRLIASGFLNSCKWKQNKATIALTRGILGEELRLMQLKDEQISGRIILQGAYVLTAAPALWAGEDREATPASQEQTDDHAQHMMRLNINGKNHTGFLHTEVDVLVLRRQKDRLIIENLENVKSGDNSSKRARSQNNLAVAKLGEPHPHLCVPSPDGKGYIDLAEDPGAVDPNLRALRLDLNPKALAQVNTITVGPAGDFGYDVRLPLDAQGIHELAVELLLYDHAQQLKTERQRRGFTD